jgi:hypothetical protein|nr:MAG TPA_asm: hypothetical protein [Caudoviricetes sp.]
MNSKKFIVTKDPEVAKKLASIFKQISDNNGSWVFINAPTNFNFAEYGKKIAFTNILCL